MNSKTLLRTFIKETVEDLFSKQFSKKGRIGKVAFEKEVLTRLIKEKMEKIMEKSSNGMISKLLFSLSVFFFISLMF